MKNERHAGRVLPALLAGAAAFVLLAAASCDTTEVPGPTEYVNYSFSYGNIYVSFTDEAWNKVNNIPGGMNTFKGYIEDLDLERGVWSTGVINYVKNKQSLKIIVVNLDNGTGGTVIDGETIIINAGVTNPNLIEVLASFIESGITDFPDY